MTQQSARTLIITQALVSILGLALLNGFFLVIGQIMQMISLHI